MKLPKPRELMDGGDAAEWLPYARLKLKQLKDHIAKANMGTSNRTFITPDGGTIRIVVSSSGTDLIYITSGKIAWGEKSDADGYHFGYYSPSITFTTSLLEPRNPVTFSDDYYAPRTYISLWNSSYEWVSQVNLTSDTVWVGRVPDYAKGGYFTISGRVLGLAFVYAAPDNDSVIVSRDQGSLGGLFEYYSYVVSPETNTDPITKVETVSLNEVGTFLIDETGVSGTPIINNLTGGLGDTATGGYASTDANFSYLVMATVNDDHTNRTPISYSVNTSTAVKASYDGDNELIDHVDRGAGSYFGETFITNCESLADGSNSPWMLVEVRRVAYTGGADWKTTTKRMWQKLVLYRGSSAVFTIGGPSDSANAYFLDDLTHRNVLTENVDIFAFSYRAAPMTATAITLPSPNTEVIYDVGDPGPPTLIVVAGASVIYTGAGLDASYPLIHPSGDLLLVSFGAPSVDSKILENKSGTWTLHTITDTTDGSVSPGFFGEMKYTKSDPDESGNNTNHFKWLALDGSTFYVCTVKYNAVEARWEYGHIAAGSIGAGEAISGVGVYSNRSAYRLNG